MSPDNCTLTHHSAYAEGVSSSKPSAVPILGDGSFAKSDSLGCCKGAVMVKKTPARSTKKPIPQGFKRRWRWPCAQEQNLTWASAKGKLLYFVEADSRRFAAARLASGSWTANRVR